MAALPSSPSSHRLCWTVLRGAEFPSGANACLSPAHFSRFPQEIPVPWWKRGIGLTAELRFEAQPGAAGPVAHWQTLGPGAQGPSRAGPGRGAP